MSSQKRKSDVGATDANKKAKTDGSIMSFFGPPKTVVSSTTATTKTSPAAGAGAKTTKTTTAATTSSLLSAAAEPAALKFDKEAWVATLTPEQKKNLGLEISTMDPSWLAVLKDEIVKPYFIQLKKFIEAEVRSGKTVFPPSEDVYSWSRHTPFNTVRCVIVGQDPYHNHNQAHGLCFSVRPPTPAPPSLKNMYKALKNDYPEFEPPPKNGGLLTPWADRGVLMLNTCLTVRAHDANSHQKRGWETFTQKVIDLVAQKRTRGVVFLAWGGPAGTRVTKIDQKRHLVLKGLHPSPLAQSRAGPNGGFAHCGHFRKANEWLVTRYGHDGQIDWNLNEGGAPTVIAAPSTTASAAVTVVKEELKEERDQDEKEVEVAEKTT